MRLFTLSPAETWPGPNLWYETEIIPPFRAGQKGSGSRMGRRPKGAAGPEGRAG